jgi:thiol:disulfide interchange protein DsbA
MRFSQYIAAIAFALPLAVMPLTASATAEAGKDYQVLSTTQPTDSAGKVEVIEFFAYTCPHCFHFEPILNAWAKKLPKNVVLKRQPVIFSDSWEPMARAYFALKALGVVDKLHDAVFNAIHVENQNLMDPDTFFDWGAKHGLDRAKLKATYESFTVSADITRAKALARDYRISGVPTLAINGKYLTSASMTGSHEKTLAVTDELIRMESKSATGKKRK